MHENARLKTIIKSQKLKLGVMEGKVVGQGARLGKVEKVAKHLYRSKFKIILE